MTVAAAYTSSSPNIFTKTQLWQAQTQERWRRQKNKAGERRDWPKFCFSLGRLQRQVLIVSVEYKNKFWWFVKILKLRLPVKKRIISSCSVEVKLNDSQELGALVLVLNFQLNEFANNLFCKIKYVPVSAGCYDVDTYWWYHT